MMRAFAPTILLLILAVPSLAGTPRPATDAEVAALVKEAAKRKDLPPGPAVVLLDEADVYVQDSGLALTRRRRLTRIQSEAGIKAFTILREGFDPHTNRVCFDSVRIHHKGGAIEEVPLEEVITQPARQGSIFWGNLQQILGLPRLEVGDCVEIRSSRIGYNIAYLSGEGAGLSGEGLDPPMPGHWYEVTRFEEGRPMLKKRYSVHFPKDKPVQFEVYGGALKTSLWFDEDRYVYTFIAEDVPAFKGDPHMASRDDCVTKLVMATLPDWLEKSRWFHRVNEGQFAADDAIREKVAEITAELPDEEAKIAACLHWVADNIRYYGTSRGACEGFTLHPSVETFSDRGGVCKDIAGMLITMLRVMDIEAYPALTMAGPRVEDIPADQFNHTVTVIRRPDGSFKVLDPTWSPVSRETWSSREAVQGLVYGTPQGEGLTASPFFGPEHNAARVKAESQITEDGRLTTRIRMDLAGYPGTYLRRSLDRRRPEDRQAALEGVLNYGPTATIEGFETMDPRDYDRDAFLTMEVAAAHYAAGGADVMLFKLPLLHHPLGRWLIPDLLWKFPEKVRRYPLRLRATRLLEYEEKIVLPPGWAPTRLPEKKKIDGPAGSLTFECAFKDGALTYRVTVRAKKHLVPVAEYGNLARVLGALKELTRLEILCRKAGGDDDR